MALTFVSSDPTSGATDVFINKTIEVVFNEALDPTSLTQNIVSLVDQQTGNFVPASLAIKPSSSATLLIAPQQVLKENTDYKLLLIGEDQGLGFQLTAVNGDKLAVTLVMLFQTGDSAFVIDTTVEKEASNITLEGDLFLPTNIKALGYDFTIDKVRPKNHTHNVPVDLTGDNTIRFTFTKDLLTGVSDYSDWMDLTVFPLLDDVEYLASGSALDATLALPGATVGISGPELVVTFDSDFPKNVGVVIDLNDKITSIDNDQYGGDLHYSINTQLYPEVYGIQSVRREIRPTSVDFHDDYIGSLLFKNTVLLWEKTGRGQPLGSLSYPAKQYIFWSTVLDLMEDKEYEKYVVSGTRRQLGDLGVSIDPMSSQHTAYLLGRTTIKIAEAQRKREIALQSIYAGWQMRTGTRATDLAAASRISRLWYDVWTRYTDPIFRFKQDDIPAANVSINRHAKTTNPIWY